MRFEWRATYFAYKGFTLFLLVSKIDEFYLNVLYWTELEAAFDIETQITVKMK